MVTRAVMWFRNDLRIEHNPAWMAATNHDELLPLVVLDERLLSKAGTIRRDQYLANVGALADDIRSLGGQLSIVKGRPEEVLPAISGGADAIYLNRATSAWGTQRDGRVSEASPCETIGSWGTLLTEPGTVLTGSGTLSRVFTPFSKAWFAASLPELPDHGSAKLVSGPKSMTVPLLDHQPPAVRPGTGGAHEMLDFWLERVDDYTETRDRPGIDGTSSLSSHLRFGTIAPQTVFDLVGTSTPGRQAFVRQLAWRDWYAHMLVENPAMLHTAVRPAFDLISWLNDDQDLSAWREGRTGYPIVDAGMRQLVATGWMHNRVRMIAGSFLVKDLLVDWREGERFFRHHLIDGEPSQNAGNWQWVAGTGLDAAPYFRVFNPVLQSRKFDPRGEYIRRWIPELAELDHRWIHAPWEAAPLELAAGGVILDDTYPAPIIDHAFARDRALTAYKAALSASPPAVAIRA